MSPADAAKGARRVESDVLTATLGDGSLKGKKIGLSLAHHSFCFGRVSEVSAAAMRAMPGDSPRRNGSEGSPKILLPFLRRRSATGIPPSRRWSAFCGTTSPAQLEPGGESRSRNTTCRGASQIPGTPRGWQARKISRQMPELPGDLGVRSRQVGQRCDFCGSTALVPYEERRTRFVPIAAADQSDRDPGARLDPRWYGTRLVRAEQAQRPR